MADNPMIKLRGLRFKDRSRTMGERISYWGDGRPSLRELAFHESGHAVVAALLGQEIEWVAIDNANGCGEAEPKTNPFCRLDEPFESRRRVIIAMAGSVVQCRSIGCDFQWTAAGEGDKRLAQDNAERAGVSSDNFSIVGEILSHEDAWKQVSGLAAVLLTRGRLFDWNGLREFLPQRDLTVCEIAGIIPDP
jgi:hypothetical protein